MHTPRRVLPALAVATALALTASACSSDAEPQADGLRVVASTTQVADITRNITGDIAELTQLLDPGASAHTFDPTPAALQALAVADVLVVNGAGLEEWLEPAIASSGFDGEIIDASTSVELIAIADDGHDEHDEHDEHDHDHDDHDHDHDHGDHDPHIWTDPASAIAMTATIADGLAALDADNADAYAANAADYLDRLETLQAWMADAFELVPSADRLLVTNHDTFRYLARAYDITVVGSVLPSFDDNAEVSAAAIDQLVADIRAAGVRAVFSEAQLSPAVAETIASEAGVEVYSGEDALFTDSLGMPGTLGETYIGSQIHNTTLMVEAWGRFDAPELPEALR